MYSIYILIYIYISYIFAIIGTHICLKLMVNVGKYTILGAFGYKYSYGDSEMNDGLIGSLSN